MSTTRKEDNDAQTPQDEDQSDLSVHASPTSARPRRGGYRVRAYSNPETASEPYKSDTITLHNKVEQMFVDVKDVIHGEMQAGFNELSLLENMNNVISKRYDTLVQRSGNVLATASKMKEQYEKFKPYFEEIDQIDQSVNELANMVKYLDQYSKTLESQLREFL